MSVPDSAKFIYIYRGSVLIKGEFRVIRFETYKRQINPEKEYHCVDYITIETYFVKGADIFNYYLYNVRPLTKSDPEYIPQLPMQQQTDYNI
jgi:hypothetical protein